MEKLPRRAVIRRGLQVISAFSLLPLVAGRAKAAESCVEVSSESLRNSLNYSDPAPNPETPCKGCGFFTADGEKPSCGHCVIMSGPVSATAWCESWSAKS